MGWLLLIDGLPHMQAIGFSTTIPLVVAAKEVDAECNICRTKYGHPRKSPPKNGQRVVVGGVRQVSPVSAVSPMTAHPREGWEEHWTHGIDRRWPILHLYSANRWTKTFSCWFCYFSTPACVLEFGALYIPCNSIATSTHFVWLSPCSRMVTIQVYNIIVN